MSRDILLLLAGGAIGLISSIVSGLVAYILEERRLKRQWAREDKLRQELQAREERELTQEFLQNQRESQLRALSSGKPGSILKPQRWYCFLPGTQVLLENRQSTAIERIEAGDALLSYDTDMQEFSTAEVTRVYTEEEKEYLVINHRIRVTPAHLFFADGRWIQARALEVGQKLLKSDGTSAVVETVESKTGKTLVYNLDLIDNQPFFAEEVLVHNQFAKQKPAELLEDEQPHPISSLEELKRSMEKGKEIEVDQEGRLHLPSADCAADVSALTG